jgi:hypothetical protein
LCTSQAALYLFCFYPHFYFPAVSSLLEIIENGEITLLADKKTSKIIRCRKSVQQVRNIDIEGVTLSGPALPVAQIYKIDFKLFKSKRTGNAKKDAIYYPFNTYESEKEQVKRQRPK